MKMVCAIAATGILCAAGQPTAARAGMSPLLHASSDVQAQAGGQSAASTWNGRWQGTTVSGQPLVLQLEVKGDHVTGRLTVARQSANIVYGKVVGDAFALTTGPIDGRTVDATGRHVGDRIELTIEGVKKPVTLTRAQ